MFKKYIKKVLKLVLENYVKMNNNIKYHRKMNRLKSKNVISSGMKNEISEYWKKYDIKISKKWHNSYISANEIYSEKYITEPLYYNLIERELNDLSMARAYKDKNSYYKFLPDAKLPKTVIKNINGKYFINDTELSTEHNAIKYLKSQNVKMIIKPSVDTGGGKSVRLLNINKGLIFMDGRNIEYDDIKSFYQHDYIIQHLIAQNKKLKNIYPKSLNTIRIMTVKLECNYQCVSSVIRFGNNDSIVDNIKTNGGVAVGVKNNGQLNDYGFTSSGNKSYSHPYSGQEFRKVYIKEYSLIRKTVEKLHENLPYFDIVSWDVALNDKNEIIIVEFNISGQEINFHQYNNGPLFGDFTDIVMKKIISL